jgi:glycosyltransferase involved in cell wall biosynthesis
MTRLLFAIPGDLSTMTGGYGYDRRIIAALPQFGIEVETRRLADRFPFPSQSDLKEAVSSLTKDRGTAVVMIDGLAYGALPPACIKAVSGPIIGLVHHPLAYEAGLSEAMQKGLHASEKNALSQADHVIATSPTTGKALEADFAVPANKITIAEPGTDRAPKAIGSGTPNGRVDLLAVGAIVPRKAYDVLINALSQIVDLNWHLRIVGAMDRAPDTVRALRDQISRLHLDERIEWMGECPSDQLEPLYHHCDVFVMPSHYEGFGMALTEAMAHGLPILSTTGGAAAQTIEDGAALKIPPADVPAMAQALRLLISDPAQRAKLSAAAWSAAGRLTQWNESARHIAHVIHALAPSR